VSPSQVASAFLKHLAEVGLIFAIAVAGVFAASTAMRGRPTYWLAAVGSALAIFGILLGPGFEPAAVTTTAIGAAIALAIFAVALDLLLVPPPPPRVDDEHLDHRFE
jgi:hypothetical protein